MSALVYTELGVQVREGSALARVLDREHVQPATPVVVCGWHERERRNALVARGAAVSDGICRECAAKLTGENFGDE